MGTIKTTNIETITGSGTLTLGQSGETISVPSGATINLSNATQTGVGGTNTKMFLAKMNANQTMSDAVATKMTMTEVLDPDSTYDGTTNYRWTPGETGKYWLFFHCKYQQTTGGTVLDDNYVWMRKNGSNFVNSEQYFNSTEPSWNLHTGGAIIDVTSASDYFELWAYINVSSGTPEVVGHSTQFYSYWGGYKLIT